MKCLKVVGWLDEGEVGCRGYRDSKSAGMPFMSRRDERKEVVWSRRHPGRLGRKTRTCEFPERQGQGRTRLRARTSSQCPLGADRRGRAIVGVWDVVGGNWCSVVGAEPTRIEDSGGVPSRVGREVEEVGHWCDCGSNLAGTGKARRQDMIVAGSGSTGVGEHADEHPVAYDELGVATMAIGVGNAFFRRHR